MMNISQVFCQFDGCIQITAGMAAHQIRHQILFHAKAFVDIVVFLYESFINIAGRFAHLHQNFFRNMLRGNFQLTADMIFTQFIEESFIFVINQVIVTNTGTNKYLFDTRKFSDFSQQFYIVHMVYIHIRTFCRPQALSVTTSPLLQLFFAGRATEVCCRTANIVDIAFKIRIPCNFFSLCNQRVMASCCNHSALMKCQRTEITVTETTTVAYQRKFYFFNGRNTAFFNIHRVVISFEIQRINLIQFRCSQGRRRRILHDCPFVIFFDQSLTKDCICILILDQETFVVFVLILLYFLIFRQHDVIYCSGNILCFINRATQESQLIDGNTTVQCLCHFNDLMFTHTIQQQVSTTIQQNRTTHFIIPVVVMAQSSQAGFNTTDDDRCFFVNFSQFITINDCCTVRTFTHFTTGCIVILFTRLFRYSIMVYHGVNVTCTHQKTQSGFPKASKIFCCFPIGLCNETNPVTMAFQHTTNNRRTERRMVNICITTNINEIRLFPASFQHFFSCYRQKRHRYSSFLDCATLCVVARSFQPLI